MKFKVDVFGKANTVVLGIHALHYGLITLKSGTNAN